MLLLLLLLVLLLLLLLLLLYRRDCSITDMMLDRVELVGYSLQDSC